MPRVHWPLLHDRPVVEVILALAQGGQQIVRKLLADTGAGDRNAGFELLLDEYDCLLCGGIPLQPVALGGAYIGPYPVYSIQVRIPLLGLREAIQVVGVPSPPAGFDGIACYRFLNRFNYGNFANQDQFGLETL
ncbi:MAG TPA: hypothetical protein VNH11_34650 [Pirellulales bacterium]|nr:hypothetical protein [Pirellulales bacterium]